MDIRKLVAVMAALTIVTGITGCGGKGSSSESASSAGASQPETSAAEESASQEETSAETSSENTEDTDYTELSRKLCQDMIDGNYKSTADLLSETAKKQLNEDALSQVWEQINTSAGSFVEMGETEEAVQTFTTTNTLLVFENMKVICTLAFNDNGEIEGILFQPAESEEITAQETDVFIEREVKIGEYALDGLLTLPKNVENPPLVILVQGSGQHNMNEGIGELATFNQISHGLAERGIATLRYNKRFYQFPDLAENGFNIDEEVIDDAVNAVDLASALVEDGEVSSIFVLGHSLGGCCAPVIAKRNPKVQGIISYAGTPRDLLEVVKDQITAQLEDAEDDMTKTALSDILSNIDAIRNGNKDVYVLGSDYSYWESLDALNIGETAKSLDIPMLFLQGDQDIQVYPDKDYPLWQEYLAGKDNCTFKLYDGIGHLFCGDDDVIQSRVLDDTADFVKSCVQ